jgi:hypothetical protein
LSDWNGPIGAIFGDRHIQVEAILDVDDGQTLTKGTASNAVYGSL